MPSVDAASVDHTIRPAAGIIGGMSPEPDLDVGGDELTGVRLAVVVEFPVGHEADGQKYEDEVLPLLTEHGGRLEQRLRTIDSTAEVHLISFSSRAGYQGYLADPRRAELREHWLDAVPSTRVLEVRPV
jgi:hypothetical protein